MYGFTVVSVVITDRLLSMSSVKSVDTAASLGLSLTLVNLTQIARPSPITVLNGMLILSMQVYLTPFVSHASTILYIGCVRASGIFITLMISSIVAFVFFHSSIMLRTWSILKSGNLACNFSISSIIASLIPCL